MRNTIFNSHAPTTLGYLEWRDTVATRGERLFGALEKLTVPELYAANDRLIGGLAAERLNPTNSHGDFHLAAGMIRSLLYRAGHKFNRGELICGRQESGHNASPPEHS